MFKKSNNKSMNEKAVKALNGIEESFNNLPQFKLSEYNKDNTAIVFVDVIKGFISSGNLSSDRGNLILDNVKKLDADAEEFHKIFLVDNHTKDSVEFDTYPAHCIGGTDEVEFEVDFNTNTTRSFIVKKNSVNGFFAPAFSEWLMNNPTVTNFIVVGLVTDICVMNFALSIKAYFNEWDIKSEVIVLKNCVETFDFDATNHDAELMNMFALYNMRMNGIKALNY